MLFALAFAAEAAEPAWDHTYAALDAFYAGAVDDTGVDYALLASRRAQLDAWLATAAHAPLPTFTPEEALAFWIDSYDALTASVMLASGPPASIRDLDGGKVWSTRSFTIADQTVTLDDIEHRRVRPAGDPRVHAALNCASRGCPPLPVHPVRGDSLDADLDAAVARWARTDAVRVDGDTIELSRIFDWYGEDFARYAPADLRGLDAKSAAALAFLAPYADGKTAESLRSPSARVSWAVYDWSLNARATP